MSLLSKIKRLVPHPLLQAYHFSLAKVAQAAYRHPSDELIVIGVTGTNGKSSTVNFIAQLLEELGETVGYTSTAGFRIAGRDVENKLKMTMPGRFLLERMLREMVKSGCKYAIIETSSQGLVQYRHLGLNYDAAVFTNLTPEHIEAHGGFENYKKAKGILFSHLGASKKKKIDGKAIDKVTVLNADDKHAAYYGSFPADRHVWYGWGSVPEGGLQATLGELTMKESEVIVNNVHGALPLVAEFERKNALAAIAAVTALGFPLTNVLTAAQSLKQVPGRFERIDEGQSFTVIVDYAYEPYALKALFDAVRLLPHNRIIGVHGSAGGGRDVARRPEIGKLAGKEESVVVVTNEDPYDEDPRGIIEAVAAGARAAGKIDDKDLFLIDDRRAAIQFAIKSAKPGDVVLLTGKGSEPVMAVANGKKIAWDDRAEARSALRSL